MCGSSRSRRRARWPWLGAEPARYPETLPVQIGAMLGVRASLRGRGAADGRALRARRGYRAGQRPARGGSRHATPAAPVVAARRSSSGSTRRSGARCVRRGAGGLVADRAACGDDLASRVAKAHLRRKRGPTRARPRRTRSAPRPRRSRRGSSTGRSPTSARASRVPNRPGFARSSRTGRMPRRRSGQLAEFGGGRERRPSGAGRSSAVRAPRRRLLAQARAVLLPAPADGSGQADGATGLATASRGGPAKVEAWFASSDPSDGEIGRRGATGERGRGAARAVALRRTPPGARLALVAQCAEEHRRARAGALGNCKRPSSRRAPGPPAAGRGHLGRRLRERIAGHRARLGAGLSSAPSGGILRRLLGGRASRASEALHLLPARFGGDAEPRFTRGSTRCCRARRRSTRARCRGSMTSAPARATTRRSTCVAEPCAPAGGAAYPAMRGAPCRT